MRCIESMKPIKCFPNLARQPTNDWFNCTVFRTMRLIGRGGLVGAGNIHITGCGCLGCLIRGVLWGVITLVNLTKSNPHMVMIIEAQYMRPFMYGSMECNMNNTVVCIYFLIGHQSCYRI